MSWSRVKTWPGWRGEKQQQVELPLGERDLLAGDVHAPGRRVDLQPVEGDGRLRALVGLVHAAQHGVDARDELAGEKGLTT